MLFLATEYALHGLIDILWEEPILLKTDLFNMLSNICVIKPKMLWTLNELGYVGFICAEAACSTSSVCYLLQAKFVDLLLQFVNPIANLTHIGLFDLLS